MYRVGKTVDDGVQRGEVQDTTFRTNKQTEGVHNVTMEGKILEKVQEKDMGVMVHQAMNGSRQVTEAVKKANRALAQIRRTISNKETDTVIPRTNMVSILEEGYQRT